MIKLFADQHKVDSALPFGLEFYLDNPPAMASQYTWSQFGIGDGTETCAEHSMVVYFPSFNAAQDAFDSVLEKMRELAEIIRIRNEAPFNSHFEGIVKE